MILNIEMAVTDSVSAEVPMRRAQSLPQSAEPVDLGGDVEACSPPPPYSAPLVQSYSMGNGNFPYNFSQGQKGSEHASKQTPAAETNNQALPEGVLTEGKQKYICKVKTA